MNHMEHPIHRVTAFEIIEPFVLDVSFDDGTRQRIDFRPVLHGELYRPLRDAAMFERVEIDPHAHTLVWPNGADFDPATLHDWPDTGPLMVEMAQRWATARSPIAHSGFPPRIIGIDYSTDDEKIGLALAVRDDEDDYSLQKATVGGRGRPASSIVVDWLNESPEAALLAIDAPLGWPLPLATALMSHTAGARIDTARDEMFRRETEVFIHRKTRQRPLDVGADKIARTAHAALHFLGTLRTRLGTAIPLAWDPATVIEHAAIEVYPAATLKVHGIPTRKKSKQERRAIADALQATLTVPKHIGDLARNEHLLDAAVCVLAAMDFIAGRAMPPPDRCRAEQEGWIWTAKPG